MALTLDIASVDRTGVLGALSAQIKRSLNQRSTATFIVDPRVSGYAPVVGNSVEFASGANKIFGGFIHSIKKRVEPGTSALKWNIRCLDYSHICDRRIVSESFPASSPGPLDLRTVVTGIAENERSHQRLPRNREQQILHGSLDIEQVDVRDLERILELAELKGQRIEDLPPLQIH